MLELHWWTQNEDYPHINDESKVTVDNGKLTIQCNDFAKEYNVIGEPQTPSDEEIKSLQEWPIDPTWPNNICDLLKIKLEENDV